MLYLHAPENEDRWRAAFADAGLAVVTAADAPDPAAVEYVAAWAPPPGLFARFAKLKAVFALGAGVDRFLGRDDLPASVPLLRLEDAGMAAQMLDYALFSVLWFQRDFDLYARRAEWRPEAARAAAETRVGVLGLGMLGGAVARGLASRGYDVAGWRRAPGGSDLPVFSGGDGLRALLARSDVVISVLPATAETRGLLDAGSLALLPPGAAVVNVGRGDAIVTEDLLAALDSGRLRGAVLDVFAAEPLPADSPLWTHPKVLVTPHVAAVTPPGPAARQVAANLARLAAGRPPTGLVDRRRGY